jgi:hypothetical protein
MTVLRQQPRAAGLVLGLIAANLLAWCWPLLHHLAGDVINRRDMIGVHCVA